MLENGDHESYTAMAKTVGVTCAIGADLLLKGMIKRKGMFGPFHKDVYEPMYKEMIDEKLILPYETHEMMGTFKL